MLAMQLCSTNPGTRSLRSSSSSGVSSPPPDKNTVSRKQVFPSFQSVPPLIHLSRLSHSFLPICQFHPPPPAPPGEEAATAAFKGPSVNHQPNKGAQLPFEIQIDDINKNEAPPCISPSHAQYFNRPCVQRRVPAVGLQGIGEWGGADSDVGGDLESNAALLVNVGLRRTKMCVIIT